VLSKSKGVVMKKYSTAAIFSVLLVAGITPALAKEDCEGGYKIFMGKLSPYIPETGANDIADAVKKSLDAYNSCKAGDSFSPHGVWDQILAEMQQKSKARG
jgi:hypothetical protein